MLDSEKARSAPDCRSNLNTNQPSLEINKNTESSNDCRNKLTASQPSNDTLNWSTPSTSPKNLRKETLTRSRSLQDFVLNNNSQFISCPNANCDYFFETFGTGEIKKIYTQDGGEPSLEAIEHYKKYRYRCRKCLEDFCSSCKKIPYHEGYTCEEYIKNANSVHCRYCDKLLLERDPLIIKDQLMKLAKNINTIVNNTCENCLLKVEKTHPGIYPSCKHQKNCTSNHMGSCYPCIHPDCIK